MATENPLRVLADLVDRLGGSNKRPSNNREGNFHPTRGMALCIQCKNPMKLFICYGNEKSCNRYEGVHTHADCTTCSRNYAFEGALYFRTRTDIRNDNNKKVESTESTAAAEDK